MTCCPHPRRCAFLLWIAAAAVMVCALPPARAQDADLATIKAQMRAYLLQPTPQTTEEAGSPVSAAGAARSAAALRPDGAWPDVDYQDQSRGGWKPDVHLSRTLALAKAYTEEADAGRPDPLLRAATLSALDHWLRADYRSPNWWFNEIGVPGAIGKVLVLMQPALSPDELAQGEKIMSRAKIGRTGQNKVWLSEVVLTRALLQNDVALARKARNAIASEFVVTTSEGLQPDWSFQQHGPNLQMGNYGLAFAGSFAEWAQILRGTSLALGPRKIPLLRSFLLQGEDLFVWHGEMDISGCGRQLFPNSPVKKAGAIYQILQSMPLIDPADAAQYQAMAERSRPGSEVGAAGPVNREFWRSDIMVHRRPAYSESIKMSSRRTLGSETVNAENIKGYYLADGATYVYRTGHEYDDIFPVWDWRRLPGITCVQAPGRLPTLTISNYHVESAFVGGVSDGTYGLAALDYNRDGLSGKKSWFCFDSETVCLGAGIAYAGGDAPVTTSVNQCLLSGPVTVSDGSTVQNVPRGGKVESTLDWVYHDGVGYYFPTPTKAVAACLAQTGTWKSVYAAGSADPVTEDVFSVWIDHGARPANGAYAYVLLPNATAANVAAYAKSPAVEILSNTPALQAVRSAPLHRTMAAFYAPGALTLAGGAQLAVAQPCLVIVEGSGPETTLWVADPAQHLATIQFTLGGTAHTIALPQGPYAGRSVAWPGAAGKGQQ